MYWADLLHKR